MRPLRELRHPVLDLSGAMPYATLQSAFDPFFPKGWLYYWKSLSMDRMDDEAIAPSSVTRPTAPLQTLDGALAS